MVSLDEWMMRVLVLQAEKEDEDDDRLGKCFCSSLSAMVDRSTKVFSRSVPGMCVLWVWSDTRKKGSMPNDSDA